MESNVEIKFNVDGKVKVYFNDQLIDEVDSKDTYYYLIEEDSTITFKNKTEEAEIQVYKDEENKVELRYDSEGHLNAKYLEESNEFSEESNEEILQTIYEKYESFFEKHRFYLAAMLKGGLITHLEENTVNSLNTMFSASIFIHILLNTSESDRNKTIKFLKNLNADHVKEIKEEFGLSHEELQETINEDADQGGYLNFVESRKNIFYGLAHTREYDMELNEEIFAQFLRDIQDAYNAYADPETPLDLLDKYEKTSVQNKSESSTKAFFMFYLPVILIIIMIVKFVMELFSDNGGIIMSGGFGSVVVFVILIIWAAIGNSGRYHTCSNCKKWNSLKLDHDYIVDSKDTWRTKTYNQNGTTYQKQVAVRVETHEEHYTCNHCGNKEVKYRDKEYEL